MTTQTRIFTALIALAAATLPLGALAQSGGSAEPPAAAPPPSYGTADESIHGRVESFDGAYSLQVRDQRGYVDNVRLHQGTVINPTGLRLVPGMVVTIHGENRGSAFAANEIDTPYQSYGFAYPYGYPAYPYPGYAYPSFSLGLGFGFGPRFHRGFR
jgi:hypothetical protein